MASDLGLHCKLKYISLILRVCKVFYSIHFRCNMASKYYSIIIIVIIIIIIVVVVVVVIVFVVVVVVYVVLFLIIS